MTNALTKLNIETNTQPDSRAVKEDCEKHALSKLGKLPMSDGANGDPNSTQTVRVQVIIKPNSEAFSCCAYVDDVVMTISCSLFVKQDARMIMEKRS